MLGAQNPFVIQELTLVLLVLRKAFLERFVRLKKELLFQFLIKFFFNEISIYLVNNSESIRFLFRFLCSCSNDL